MLDLGEQLDGKRSLEVSPTKEKMGRHCIVLNLDCVDMSPLSTGRHVCQFQSAVMPAHSKISDRQMLRSRSFDQRLSISKVVWTGW